MCEKIIVFGGSFNPIHEGHLKIAEDALEAFDADKLLFVPSLNHPTKHKIINQVDILNMLKLTISSSILSDSFEIESFELEHEGMVSYTYNTIKYLKIKYPNSKLFLLIGSDNLSTLTTWQKYDELKDMVTFIVGKREGYTIDTSTTVIYSEFETSAPKICSSNIREAVAHGIKEIQNVDIDVVEYIKNKNLYKK